VRGPGAGGNWGWRKEKGVGKSKVTRILGRETGANEGAEGDKVACKQGGGLGMCQGGKERAGPRGMSQEGRGSAGGQQTLPAGGQRPGGTTGGEPRS